MAEKRRGLGRGMDELLKGSRAAKSKPDGEPVIDEAAGDQLKTLPVDKIDRGTYQPRRHFAQEALEELGCKTLVGSKSTDDVRDHL